MVSPGASYNVSKVHSTQRPRMTEKRPCRTVWGDSPLPRESLVFYRAFSFFNGDAKGKTLTAGVLVNEPSFQLSFVFHSLLR